MLVFIDSLLNRITMYRLVLYYLIALLGVAAAFGALHILPYAPLSLGFTTAALLFSCFVANKIFADAFGAQPNVESVYITALILALIITPVAPSDISGIAFLLWAGVWAMASKYILALHRKHLFNPAAFAVALTALTIDQSASWWVGGNLPLFAFVLAGGLLIVRKIQRTDLVLTFFAGAVVSILVTGGMGNPAGTLQKALLHTPLFFFAFVMITEPLTTPPTRALRIIYGALTGLIFAPGVHIAGVYSTPELALLTGNIFSYAVSPKKKYVLELADKQRISDDIYNFIFEEKEFIRFTPGQYMEWTLAHAPSDGRGNRRYFTIASSPTEAGLQLGIKFYDPSSSFKKAMLAMRPGARIVGGQLAGDFTLPRDARKKLAFIAGGIGITPFRSMVKFLVDVKDRRDVVMLYSNRAVKEIAYREIFDEAEQEIGMRTVYAITDPNEPPLARNGYSGRIDAALIEREIPDYRDRIFYISGTHAMTTAFKATLAELGVPRANVKTDFFPGFV